jgi:hypothetical protein
VTLTRPTNESGSTPYGERRDAHGASVAGRDLSALTRIVKDRRETGAYGAACFKVTWPILEAMRAEQPAGPPKPRWRTDPLGDLLSIPVTVDDTLPADTWRLVDVLTGAVLLEGTAPVGGATDSAAAT